MLPNYDKEKWRVRIVSGFRSRRMVGLRPASKLCKSSLSSESANCEPDQGQAALISRAGGRSGRSWPLLGRKLGFKMTTVDTIFEVTSQAKQDFQLNQSNEHAPRKPRAT